MQAFNIGKPINHAHYSIGSKSLNRCKMAGVVIVVVYLFYIDVINWPTIYNLLYKKINQNR